MATVATPDNSTLPAAGGEIISAPLTGYINNILSFCNEAGNIDEANCDLTSANGLMGLSQAQTRTGSTTFKNVVTVGIDDTGHDVTFFGATAGKKWVWDESADKMVITGAASVSGTVDIASDVTIFDDANNADTSLSIGTSATEALKIEVLNGASNKTAEEIKISTATASGTANHGKISFYVDGTEIFDIDDGGIDMASGKTVAINGTDLAAATGDFTGPGSSTDNAVVRFDGTGGKTGQTSSVLIDDSNNVTGLVNVTLSGELDAGSLDISGNADIDGTLETDALSIASTTVTTTAAEINLIDGGTARGTDAVASGDGILINDAGTMKMTNVDTVSTYFASHSVGGTNIATVGTIGTGTWQGTAIASAYLDADTAHLSTTQTFTGDKTFTGTVTVGVDDTGKDVKFFGASAGAYMEWDESADQLRIMGASADATTSTGKLLLATSLTDINANDVIGKIDFSAPHESGTDATAIAASIQAVAQGTFAAALNATDLLFLTGHSEAATEKIRITSQGEIGIGGANYGSDGQVLTSAGAGAAVAWESVTASGVTAMNSATENELVTVGATTTELDAESNLTFTGSALTVTGTATVTSTITAGGVVDVTDGSASAPAICNTGDTNTGILFPAADTIGMTTAGTERVRIGSYGELFVNETANTNQTNPGNMTLNQAAFDGAIVAFKSSDVAHGITDYQETDTYADFRKSDANSGGLIVRGFDENANGLQLWGFYADTSSNSNLSAKTAAATAPVSVIVAKKSGTGIGQVPADENIFMIQAWNQAARFVVDEDGEIYSDGSHSSYDEYDDAQMLRAMDHSLDAPGLLMGKFDDMLEYNEASLIEAGLLGGPRKGQPETERGLINYTGMVRLQSGAIWQLYTQQREMREVLENQVKELRDEILALREKN